MRDRDDLSPADPPPTIEQRIQKAKAFWELLDVSSRDAGETTLGGLEDLRADFKKCLNRTPPDITSAEAITAYAALLLSGEQFC